MKKNILLPIVFGFLVLHLWFTAPVAAQGQTNIVGPAGSIQFGTQVVTLPNGNFVVTDPNYNAPGPIANTGRVYLYNGTTLALINTMTGSTADDGIGSGGITVLANGNYVVSSPGWNGGAGAVTQCNSTTGCPATITAANSLVGSTANDAIGSNITALPNGNYVTNSQFWDNGAITDVGAVTFCNGTTGCTGAVTATNSLVGSTANDSVGNAGIKLLSNGNYLVHSIFWNNGAATFAGAVTRCSGTTGCTGAVSAANSLVGATANEFVGSNDIFPLTNGGYVVCNGGWDNGATMDVGSATFCNSATGCTGTVTTANSLIGSTAGDQVGLNGVTVLTNGNYVVRSQLWANGATAAAGAATFCNGATGCIGTVSPANSLVGSTANDGVGRGATALTNGNYVVSSSDWDNPSPLMQNVGAVTWCSGTTGCTGAVSTANSLVGPTQGESLSSVTALTNGNYVVNSAFSSINNFGAGAVRWCNGTTGCVGTLTLANSLVGSAFQDRVGENVTALSNGNYLVHSPFWDNGVITDAGAVTFCNGASGCVGTVSSANSLVGSTINDRIGASAIPLSSGNYVVRSISWDNGAITDAGAVTQCSGTTGCIGQITAANSLVGSTANDVVGGGAFCGTGGALCGVTPLSNGNYIVKSAYWDNGAATDSGAVSYGFGSGGTVGPITINNSVLGTAADGGTGLNFSFDSSNNQLAVGRPADNIVTVFHPGAPTAVELVSFTATAYDNGVLLKWQSGFEVNNLGFNIYRGEGGRRIAINQQLVAGSALTAGFKTTLQSGEVYQYWDNPANNSAAYWLEDVDLNGNSTLHGPFYAEKAKSQGQKEKGASLLLSEVGKGQTADKESAVVERRIGISTVNDAVLLEQAGLASGEAVKIMVKREGLYRVNAQELFAVGLSRNVEARTLQMFVDGQEIPIRVSTGINGRFDDSSFVEFYGLGLDTPSTDTRVYWLSQGTTQGKRITQSKGEGVSSLNQSFSQTVERRDRTIYFPALLNGDKENFFGALVVSQGIDQTLNLPHLQANAPQPATVEVTLQGVTQQPHRLLVELNGNNLGFVEFNGQQNHSAKFSAPHLWLTDGINTVRLISQNGQSDISLVDAIRISYQHLLVADNNSLKFTVQSKEQVSISGFTTKAIRVFDVTNPDAPQELLGKVDESKAGGYSITVAPQDAGVKQLLALTDGQVANSAYLKANLPSALKQAPGADFVTIASREFFNALEPLKKARSDEGHTVAVVDIEDIYDEFNFGHKSPQAIRDFLSYAKTTWKVKPRFVLFVGDASYDAKNYLGAGEFDIVPTKLIDTNYLETASDDWFSDFNNDGIADLATGRLPVRTIAEASQIINKIVRYNESRAEPRALLVSDANDGFDFEAASSQVRTILQSSLRVDEIQRGQTDTQIAKAQLLEAITEGRKLINYNGHGSTQLWRGNLLTSEGARELRNDQLPVFVMMNCLNGYFHDAAQDSLGESLLKAERGGALAVWASSGLTAPQQQAMLNQQFYRLLFSASSKATTLGEAVRQAKATITDVDVRRTWILLGDPTLRIK